MKIDVVMPKLGESITEGTIVEWKKQPGDSIEANEILLDVATDKVDTEIPCAVSGVVVELLYEEKTTVPVLTVIARIETDREIAQAPRVEMPAPPSPEPTSSPAGRSSEGTARKPSSASRFYSPAVLKIAADYQIPLSTLEEIPGSGMEGRLTKKDLIARLKSGIPRETADVSAPSVSLRDSGDEVIPLDPLHQAMAKHMRHSLDTAAHAWCISECDVTALARIIQEQGSAFEEEEGFKLTFMPFILHAVAVSLREFPRLNSTFLNNEILHKSHIHLGVATATRQGLLVPVLGNADEKNIRGLARHLHDLISRTRDKKIQPDELQGSTFSITNFGVFGTITGIPIINQPNVGILGVGAVRKLPVVLEGPEGDSIAIRSRVYLSLGFDHRIVDGATSAGFLQRVVYHLENFDEDL